MIIKKHLSKMNDYITEAKNIYIMMHSDSDLDAIGSAIALYDYLEKLNKTSYVIFDDKRMELGVKRVYNTFKDKVNFVLSKDIEENIKSSDLLFVVDTSNPYLLSNVKILDKFKTIVNIDHHDRGRNKIKASLAIIDLDASSTCEMMAEILDITEAKPSSTVATVLLAGIVLDTNGYTIKTNEKTFHYSAYLMSCGADNNEVQYLLKQDLKKYIERQKVIAGTKVINGIALAKGSSRRTYKREDLAKIADSILLFNNVQASFVVAKLSKAEAGVSARSYGNVNVGKILSKFGGGGDEQGAATKTKDFSMNELYLKLAEEFKKL